MKTISSSTTSNSVFSSSHSISILLLRKKAQCIQFKPAPAKKNTNGSDFESESGLVDESMIVLRKRIHGMEVVERNYCAPSHWMEWEKRYYATYKSNVCRFVGLIQILLLKARPGLAIGLLGLIGLSLPASVILIWMHVIEIVRAL